MKTKIWIAGWICIVLAALLIIGAVVFSIDPYFHFHKPKTDKYYYQIDNQRYQNDGISRNFDYDAIITGTSMTENFKTSEMDELFKVHSVKVPYYGGSYKEVNDNVSRALKNNENIKMVFRGLDTDRFLEKADKMRTDLGEYPTYLYDENPFNDVEYIFNKDVIFKRVYKMIQEKKEDGFVPGITSFDDYSRWQNDFTFGINTVAHDGVTFKGCGDAVHLKQEEKDIIKDNISKNVTALAQEYPNVEFYYFFTPYSILWYKELVENGTIYRQIEAEEYIIERISEHKNIHLFSLNAVEDIITDINNYKDITHYATWVSTYILKCMHDGKYLLTKENYKEHLENELQLYLNFDYESLNDQIDYEDDNYQEVIFNNQFY